MELTATELIQARETVQSLLEQVGLKAYLFEVEPRGDNWEIRIECAPNSGWQSSVFNIDEAWLDACRVDAKARAQLVAAWRERLQATTD